MLKNARVATFTVSELLRENEQGENCFPSRRLGLSEEIKKIPQGVSETLPKLLPLM